MTCSLQQLLESILLAVLDFVTVLAVVVLAAGM
jgi:hypothetical protein